jgi:hypothetical protein
MSIRASPFQHAAVTAGLAFDARAAREFLKL